MTPREGIERIGDGFALPVALLHSGEATARPWNWARIARRVIIGAILDVEIAVF